MIRNAITRIQRAVTLQFPKFAQGVILMIRTIITQILRAVTLLVVGAACLLSLLVTMILIATAAGSTFLIFVFALAGCVFFVLAYQLLPTSTRPIQPMMPPGVVRTTASADARGEFLRYGLSLAAVGFGVLCFALILAEYGQLDKFVIFGPLILIFPLSYFAYTTFQRKVRLESLKRDFVLLGVIWDDNLAKLSRGFSHFALHIILAMLFTLIGLLTFSDFYNRFGIPSLRADSSTLQYMRFGFLGAYLFAVQLIYRRYTTYDLQPPVYLYSALIIFAGLAFNYVAFEAVSGLTSGSASGSTSSSAPQQVSGLGNIVAFALGFFPILAIQWLTRLAYAALTINQPRSEDMPLGMIDGISQFHDTRLRDNGIDNVQNLASADIPALLVNTTFSVQEVVDWVDQAILFTYLTKKGLDSGEFSRVGVRTITNFRNIWKKLYQPTECAGVVGPNDAQRKVIATQFKYAPEQLDLLYEAATTPNVFYVTYYWRMTELTRKGTYLSAIIANYSNLLEDVDLLSFDQIALDVRRQTADDLRADILEESDNGSAYMPRNSLAMTGLGDLYWKTRSSKEPDLVGDLFSAIGAYLCALKHNEELNCRINAHLTATRNEMLDWANKWLNQAGDRKIPADRKQKLENDTRRLIDEGCNPYVQWANDHQSKDKDLLDFLTGIDQVKHRLEALDSHS